MQAKAHKEASVVAALESQKNTSTTRRRIVFFDFAVALGGSITVLQNTLRALDKSRFEATVFTALPDGVAQDAFAGLGVKVITHHHLANYVMRFAFIGNPRFSSPMKKRIASYLFTVYSALVNWIPFARLLYKVWRIQPHLMHTHNGIDSMLVARLLNIPAALHLHGPYGMDSKFEIALAKQARQCLCVSKGIADMLIERGVGHDSVVVIPNPSPVPQIDMPQVELYRRKFSVVDKPVVLAHVGRLVAWKGQLEFLKAFAICAAVHPNMVAVIVGGDVENLNEEYVAELHAYVDSIGLSDRVIFTGHVKDVQNLVGAVDVVVHSSIEPEPFGLVVTEAMALGKPVVAADLGAMQEIVVDGVTGLLCNPRDAKRFAEALARLVEDEQLRRCLGAAALVRVQREYSLESYCQRIHEIYDKLG